MAKGKYHEWLERDGLLKLQAWARDGYTDAILAQKMDISTSTLYKWKDDYPEIAEALKRGKEVVDIEVENALLKRALGYEYEETKEEYGPDGTLRSRVVTKKHVLPDVTAQIFWNKNRKPEEWRDKREVVSGKTVEDLTPIAEMLE